MNTNDKVDDKERQTPRRGFGVSTVYETLRNEIIELKLAPGSPIDEVQLSERFELSRTPIREALVKLSAEGLITTLTNRATIVSQIDFLGLPEFFDALTLMYRVTTRLAAANHTADNIVTIKAFQKSFERAVDERDVLAMISTNRDFHLAIAYAGGNRHYAELFTRLLDEGRRILRLYYSSFNDVLPRHYVSEHEDMIQAIIERNVDKADKLAVVHADQIVEQIRSYITADTRQSVDIAL
ncbi:putative GntR family transcriptional regulator [Agrobacterium rubi TR3 = NBRC 13261]|uniref:Putative GntR family transcriptional regulator n=1 Tax=Agrobacterium rubi TR3 = NBRC 13261 TaxID=1368415 RepID=A0A081CTM9_9HYPH|nr:GntR family transcriptional regulator [Agrobacterium rubi]MBP1878457.1 DNA-binding GntR family transcriptional regulator [Agrobacterium rubi]GAK70025.1 putative GntR family transcriptional regulator [Agrobacterium rubi TR3 = NBRC 13261]